MKFISKWHVLVLAMGLTLGATANAQNVVTSVQSSDTYRPCLFVRIGTTTFYTVSRTAANYSEIRQIAMTSFVMKVPVFFYFTGVNKCGVPEIEAITFL
jgi:hypothetical protein